MKKILIVNANYYNKISRNLVSSSKKILISNNIKSRIFTTQIANRRHISAHGRIGAEGAVSLIRGAVLANIPGD